MSKYLCANYQYRSIHKIGTLVATYEVSLWLLPSLTLLIQIILSFFSIVPQINNINEFDHLKYENSIYQTKINLADNGINIISGKLGKFIINKKIIFKIRKNLSTKR